MPIGIKWCASHSMAQQSEAGDRRVRRMAVRPSVYAEVLAHRRVERAAELLVAAMAPPILNPRQRRGNVAWLASSRTHVPRAEWFATSELSHRRARCSAAAWEIPRDALNWPARGPTRTGKPRAFRGLREKTAW
jgi:hypothetical protein